MMTISDESTIVLFKKWLTSYLKTNQTTITFTKKDGTERIMNCTTSAEIIPSSPSNDIEIKREKKPNDDVCCVFDIEAQGWRSFRWDSIKSINFNIEA